jgi:hypothetical protein
MERSAYSTDLSDEQWALIEPLVTVWKQDRVARSATGDPGSCDLREVVNALLYQITNTAVEHGGGDSYRVTGDLSIKGTTNPVTLDVEFTGAAHDPMGNDRIGFEIGCTVNRKDWGITWNAPLEAGGVLVGDKVTLDIDVSAVKRSG